MILKIAQFRKNKPELIRNVKLHGVNSISFFCSCTGLPVAAACVFVKEEFPELEQEMERKLQVLSEFYDYDGIEE